MAILEAQNLAKSYAKRPVVKDVSLSVKQGEIVGLLGPNGAGKTTLLKCLVDEIAANEGTIKWAENAAIGYVPQDSTRDFDSDLNLFDWMSQWRLPKHDDLQVKAMLGRLLFSADDHKKKVKVCSGGEKNRLLFGKLMLQDINVIIMDEPTNHLDMESIESINNAVLNFDGTVIFVSHDREFVSTLATSIIEVKNNTLNYFQGCYDEYLSNAK